MGLWSKVAGIGLKVASFTPGIGGVIGKVGGGLMKVGQLAGKVPGVVRKGGAIAGAGAAFELGGRAVRGGRSVAIDPRTGKPYRHRRGQGLSARDIRGAQKVARIVQHFGYKPKIKPRKHKRY